MGLNLLNEEQPWITVHDMQRKDEPLSCWFPLKDVISSGEGGLDPSVPTEPEQQVGGAYCWKVVQAFVMPGDFSVIFMVDMHKAGVAGDHFPMHYPKLMRVGFT